MGMKFIHEMVEIFKLILASLLKAIQSNLGLLTFLNGWSAVNCSFFWFEEVRGIQH